MLYGSDTHSKPANTARGNRHRKTAIPIRARRKIRSKPEFQAS
jgi:hypothetical protein